MRSPCSYFLSAVLLASALPSLVTAADSTLSGVISVGAGGSLLDGNRAAFQKNLWRNKDGFGGLEEGRYLREFDDGIARFELRALPTDHAYLISAYWEKTDRFYIDAGFSQSRVWYDGSGGYLPRGDLAIQPHSDIMGVDRGRLWFEVGFVLEDRPHVKLRYQRDTRDGRKGSTHWGDTSLSAVGARGIVPSFLDLDETRDTVTADVEKRTEDGGWKVGLRYDHSELGNKKYSRRQPGAAADRYLTTTDRTSTDIFTAHGYIDRTISKRLRVSAGGMTTTLDTNLDGARIYGGSYDAIYDPLFVRRQARDEGYFDLSGGSEVKQYVGNLNAVYTPAEHWSIRPSIRLEALRTETMADFIETNVGTTSARLAILDELGSESDKDWFEVTERIEVRYTGQPNWTHSFQAEWLQGKGDLNETLLERESGHIDVERETEITRQVHKYSYTANWYARPGLTFAAQTYYKLRMNDLDTARDSTPPGTADRYPAYITDQDFETTDFNLRMSWRPASLLSFVTRYDYQQSEINSIEAGLTKVRSAKLRTSILSQSVTWQPIPRLYFIGTVNITHDTLRTPASSGALNSENDYLNTTLAAAYALDDRSDLLLDVYYYNADNYVDNSAVSVPYAADNQQRVASLTWTRRMTDHLVCTLKYTFASNRDELSGGRNNYDANTLYGKVQYRF